LAGLVLAGAAGAVVLRYRRDRTEAEVRVGGLDRRSVPTPFGPLEYCEWGEGQPLLLVHGVVGGCDVPPSWRALVPAGYRIITPSRFGYLGSPLPEAASTADQADGFAFLFDALGIERSPVLAFSAGSTSAVQFALRHPSRVAAVLPPDTYARVDRLMAEKYRLDRVLILPIYRLVMKLRGKPIDERSAAYLAITST
jgi:pimeloyl-ACP methyl ester carboxylesterase